MGGVPGALRPPQEPGKSSRLTYILAKYWQAIEADFARVYPQHDVGTLWRSRRWRLLLNLIDHLPQNTWYQAAVSTDVEHAMMVLEAQKEAKKRKRPGDAPPGPSLAIWSPEVDMLAKVVDAIGWTTFAVAKSQGGKPKEPKAVPRPATAMEVARLRIKQRDHETMKARLLPQRQSDDE